MNQRDRLKIEASCDLIQISSFEGLGLNPLIMKALIELNAQVKLAHTYALKLILSQRDLLLISPSGSGRGSATMIGILQNIDYNMKCVQAIVISPEKRLAEEYLESLQAYAKYTGLTSILCSGNMMVDLNCLNSQVIVCTCGKLRHFLDHGRIDTTNLKIIVCDIANKLFKESMARDTEYILNYIKRPCRYWFLSPKIHAYTKNRFLLKARNPEIIEILRDERSLEEATFYAKVVDSVKEKHDFIHGLAYHSQRQMIIFSNNIDDLEKIEELLVNLSSVILLISYSKIHIKTILDDFKNEITKVLICESKSQLCRKIETKHDVDVINLDIPKKIDIFLMRMRRFNYHAEDRVYIVESPEKYVSLQELAGELSLKIVHY